MQRLEIIVIGRVQGVGFRYFAHRHALRLDLKGYVRNVGDDTVEIVAEGADDALHELANLVIKGPSMSVVTKYNLNYYPATGEFDSFKISH